MALKPVKTTTKGPDYSQVGPDYSQVGADSSTSSADFGDSVWGVPTTLLGVTLRQSPTSYTRSGNWDPWRKVDHTATVQELLSSFNSLDADTLTQLQVQLLLNGYDTRKLKNVRLGSPDPGSYAAYVKAIKATTRDASLTLDDVLNRVPANGKNLAGLMTTSTGTKVPHINVVQHTAATDLEAAALSGFQTALGRGPSAAESKAFMAGYRQRETAAQPSTEGGGTFNINDPGNPTTAAEAYARSAAPKLAQAHDKLGVFDMVLKALGTHG